jgi:hypothetical protein
LSKSSVSSASYSLVSDYTTTARWVRKSVTLDPRTNLEARTNRDAMFRSRFTAAHPSTRCRLPSARMGSEVPPVGDPGSGPPWLRSVLRRSWWVGRDGWALTAVAARATRMSGQLCPDPPVVPPLTCRHAGVSAHHRISIRSAGPHLRTCSHSSILSGLVKLIALVS